MLVGVVCGQQTHSNMDCYMSPCGDYLQIKVMRFCLSHLDCTKKDLIIQECHQSYRCMLHLHSNGHVDIDHYEHI